MPTTLIFGASRGLGRAFTDHALQLGHRVVALGCVLKVMKI